MNKLSNILIQVLGGVALVAAAWITFSWVTFWLFTVGVVVGIIFLWIDQTFLYTWYQNKTNAAVESKVTQSLLFILVYVLTSIFIISSTVSPLGIGMCLGIGAALVSDVLFMSSNPVKLNQVLGVKKPLGARELQVLVGGVTLLYLILVGLTFSNGL